MNSLFHLKSGWLVIALFTSLTILSAYQVDTIVVYSESMEKPISNIVILPDDYLQSNENYEVVYLLHGAGGNHMDWITNVPKIKNYADQYNLIIVCPDGGYNSWYFDSPIDLEMKYETYISQELIGAIDSLYKTSSFKSSRAITGLSMGGHGAFYLAFKNQDIWGAAGSMSGGLNLCPFPDGWDIAKRLGSYKNNKGVWKNNTVINMVHLLKEHNPKLIFDCGYDDFFYKANKQMHKKLKRKNIAHEYDERPGEHNWDFWSNSIEKHFVFFSDYFRNAE